jgi:hypothetical protein
LLLDDGGDAQPYRIGGGLVIERQGMLCIITGVPQQTARQRRVEHRCGKLCIAGPVLRRQQGRRRPGGSAQHILHDGSPIDGVGNGLAYPQIARDRVLQVETEVGEVAAGYTQQPDTWLPVQVSDEFGRQVVLQQIQFATQQLQRADRGITDTLEFHQLTIGDPLQDQPAGIGPRMDAERAVADRLPMQGMATGNGMCRHDADHQVARELCIGMAELEVQRVVIQYADVFDQAQGTGLRRDTAGRQDGAIGRCHILCRQRSTVVKRRTRPAQVKAPAQRVQLFPVGQ